MTKNEEFPKSLQHRLQSSRRLTQKGVVGFLKPFYNPIEFPTARLLITNQLTYPKILFNAERIFC